MEYYCSHKIKFSAFIVNVLTAAAAAINGAYGYTVVTGTVFCDQCKDGQISLFDYPLHGVRVVLACPGNDSQNTTRREETTNWLGNYVIKFDGTPILNGCHVQVSGSDERGPNGCGTIPGPAKYVRQMINTFNMEMYSVDPLLAQPEQPMSFCSSYNVPYQPPPISRPPHQQQPPLPSPSPLLKASACSFRKWILPEYKCRWRVLTPDTKVAVVFGLLAAQRYGPDLTLMEGLMGRGDPYKALLREGTTSLLNYYSSLRFSYHPLDILERMNVALDAGSTTKQVLRTVLRFMRANNGVGSNKATCSFTACP